MHEEGGSICKTMFLWINDKIATGKKRHGSKLLAQQRKKTGGHRRWPHHGPWPDQSAGWGGWRGQWELGPARSTREVNTRLGRACEAEVAGGWARIRGEGGVCGWIWRLARDWGRAENKGRWRRWFGQVGSRCGFGGVATAMSGGWDSSLNSRVGLYI